MQHKNKSFVFYNDWYDAICEIDNRDVQLELFLAVARFALDEVEPEDKTVKTLFNFMLGQIKRDKVKYDINRKQRSEAGKNHKGNQYTRAKEKAEENGTSVPFRSKNGTNRTVNVNENVNVNANDDNNVIVVDTTTNTDNIEIVEAETIEETFTDKIPFHVFWEAYDKKNDRKQCESKWNNLSMKKQTMAMEGVRIYKINQPNKRYRKDPIRYLRDAMWENSEICKEIIYDNDNTSNNTMPIGEGGRRRTQLDNLEAALHKGQG